MRIQRKRVRISDVAAEKRRTTREATAESDDSDGPDDGDYGGDSPPKTQYEMKRDQDYRHLAHEAADFLHCEEKVKVLFSQRKNVTIENQVADNGVIETVECTNFMCHRRLVVDLGPLINFIVGENGSGKSAVLTAITLCLGAKASSTNRGGSLKDLIKEGQDHASIMVKLKNQGESAFRPDVFGESIIVERQFSRNGSSGFKLKSTNKRIISTKKRDVDEMVEYFCLQMDNPLNVLSQDNARQFLNASSPALKYKYFVQGVQLEALDNDYKLVMETAENIDQKLQAAKTHVDNLRRKSEAANQQLELVQKNQEMRDKRRLYSQQRVWIQVEEAERLAASCDDKVAEAADKIATEEANVARLEELRNAQRDTVASAEEVVGKMRDEMKALRDVEETKKEQFTAARVELMETRGEQRQAKTLLTQAQKQKEELEGEIAAEESRLTEATGDARAAKEQELNEAQEKVRSLETERTDNKKGLAGLAVALQAAEAAVPVAKKEVDRVKACQRATDDQLRQARGRGSAACPGLHPRTDDLLREIDRAGGWDHKPIGPVGRYVTLRKPEWTTVVERHLGTSLGAYIVTSYRDQQKLYGLAKRIGVGPCHVLISKGGELDLRGKEPAAEFETMLRVLEFDNTVVRDQLVIHHAIEQTLLVKEREAAQQVLWHKRVANIKFAYCRHDRRRDEFHSLRPGGRIDPVKPYHDARPRLRTDDVAQVRHLDQSRVDLQAEYREVETRWRDAAKRVAEAKAAVAGAGREGDALEKQLRLARASVTTIETELDQYENNDSKLNAFKANLVEVEKKIEHQASQMVNFADSMKMLSKKVEAVKQEKDEISQQVQDWDVKLKEATKAAQTRKDEEKSHVKDLNHANEQRDLARMNKQRLEEERVEKQEAAVALEREARQHIPERVAIPEGTTADEINRKYEKVKEQLKKFEQRLGASEAQVAERAAKARDDYDTAWALLKGQMQLQRELNQSLDERLNRWRLFQRFLSARTRVNFTYLLSERGMRGNMRIDHKSKRLSLLVEPDETQANAKGRQTKTLSGGEKSYASICMLLAIWEAMGSSIRCLDEFDVFMDNVNRTIATQMLVCSLSRIPSHGRLLTRVRADFRRSPVRDATVHPYYTQRHRGPRCQAWERRQDYSASHRRLHDTIMLSPANPSADWATLARRP
jgi:structural maintenance of chromosomes protein 6